MLLLLGGVGELWQGDLDLGRLAVERLEREPLGSHVVVEELSYGAVAVAQRLQDLAPDALVLVGAMARHDPPGTVRRRLVTGERRLPPAAGADAVRHAVTGYVDVDLVVDVAAALGGLPRHTVVVEVEPATTGPSIELSPQGAAGLEAALAIARAEARRAPLLDLLPVLRGLLSDGRIAGAPATAAMGDLVADLAVVAREGRWGTTFRSRDRLRLHIAEGATGEGMEHLDWALWWTAIEELDRLEAGEAGLSPPAGPR